MKYYFHLQYKMAIRHLQDFGLPIFVSLLLAISLFIGVSAALFIKTTWAAHLYLVLAAYLILPFSNKERNDFLVSFFPKKSYYQVRIIENLLCSLPFLGFLLYKKVFLFALLLVGIALLLAFFRQKNRRLFIMPTPFYRYPFEFIIGFRRVFYLLIIPYILLFFSINGQNFEVGIFALLLLALICASFYSETEKEYFVWVHAFSPQHFLFHKIKIAVFYLSLLIIPIFLAMLWAFPQQFVYILGAQIIGYLYIVAFVLAKYTHFPDNIDLVHGLFLTIGIFFPPFLLLCIPLFYAQSHKKLSQTLHD